MDSGVVIITIAIIAVIRITYRIFNETVDEWNYDDPINSSKYSIGTWGEAIIYMIIIYILGVITSA